MIIKCIRFNIYVPICSLYCHGIVSKFRSVGGVSRTSLKYSDPLPKSKPSGWDGDGRRSDDITLEKPLCFLFQELSLIFMQDLMS